jgi:hypothetical protein
MSCGSAVEVRAALVIVLRDMQGDVQPERGLHKILRVIGLVSAQRETPPTALALGFEHQQRGLAFSISVSRGSHRGSDQAVAVLHQRVAQTGQMRFLAIALFVQPRVRVGGRFMRLVRTLLPMKVGPFAAPGIGVRTSFGRKLFCDANAWTSVPSTVK